MLASASREYDDQQRLAALAVAEAERLAPRGSILVAQTVQQYQAAAIEVSMEALAAILAEQGIAQAADAVVQPVALLGGVQALSGMLDAADTNAAFARLVQTLVGDAQRTARAVDAFTRPAVTGYVRSLRPPSCSRCVILAGRVYTHSTGFLRHPQDDCLMTPTSDTIGPQLITDPMEAFEKGWIKDLSKKDTQAVLDGDNLASVVNVHRRGAGLSVGSSVTDQTSPQDLMAALTDRLDAFAALRSAGFIA